MIERGYTIRNLIKIIEILEDEYNKTDDLDLIVDIIIDALS